MSPSIPLGCTSHLIVIECGMRSLPLSLIAIGLQRQLAQKENWS
jgi:hypothetical protein